MDRVRSRWIARRRAGDVPPDDVARRSRPPFLQRARFEDRAQPRRRPGGRAPQDRVLLLAPRTALSTRTLSTVSSGTAREAPSLLCAQTQAVRLRRPLRRRLDTIARPARVLIRNRKPCTRARRRLFGWKVLLPLATTVSPRNLAPRRLAHRLTKHAEVDAVAVGEVRCKVFVSLANRRGPRGSIPSVRSRIADFRATVRGY